MLEWDWNGFRKKGYETNYAKYVFLHLVGSSGHVIHYDTFRTQNIDRLFFMLRWDRYGFHKKRTGTHYTKFVFFHLVGSAGDVRSGASGARNVDALFLMLGGTSTDSTKSTLGHVKANLCFSIRWDLHVTLCIPLYPGRETLTHYFQCSCGTGTDFTKSLPGHITPNLCFCIRWDLWVT
jgi:hypothetical protein